MLTRKDVCADFEPVLAMHGNLPTSTDLRCHILKYPRVHPKIPSHTQIPKYPHTLMYILKYPYVHRVQLRRRERSWRFFDVLSLYMTKNRDHFKAVMAKCVPPALISTITNPSING